MWRKLTHSRESMNLLSKWLKRIAWRMFPRLALRKAVERCKTTSPITYGALVLEAMTPDLSKFAGFDVHIVEKAGMMIWPILDEDFAMVVGYAFCLENDEGKRLVVKLPDLRAQGVAQQISKLIETAVVTGVRAFQEKASLTDYPAPMVNGWDVRKAA